MRLYFDECCSRRLARELKSFYSVDYPDLETCHVLDFYDPATAESTWLQPLYDDRLWIPITNDHGRNSKKEKFHAVCVALGITYVAMTPGLIKAGYTEHKNALTTVWENWQNFTLCHQERRSLSDLKTSNLELEPTLSE